MLDINFYEKELQKELARKDHLEFIKYTWECTAPYLVGYHIKLICNRIDDVIEKFRNGESSFTIISIPYRHGKKLYVNDLVITPQGFRKHGDIKPGDYVCGRKGHPVKVIAKTSVTNDLDNLITFSDGTQLTCHDNHEWVVWDRSRRIERIVETWEMASHLYNGTRPRFLVDSNICIDFPEKPLSIHPYVLGVWLGDGSTGKNNINMSKQDYAVSEKMELLGYKITGRSAHKDTGVLSIYFRKLYKELKNENLLNNKHIPDNYIYNSKKNRLELLAGLIDTDGYINKKDGRVCFSNTNKQIVDTVKILVNSLGKRVTICKYKARTSSSGIIGKKDVYQVLFIPPEDIPTVLNRRKSIHNGVNKRRGILKIEKIDPKPGNCIQVEGGIYLAGKTMIPTHNSEIVSRTLPPHFLAEFPEKEIIVVSHTADKAYEFSKDGRKLVRDNTKFHELYPDIKLAPDIQNIKSWRLDNERGKSQYFGFNSKVAGAGAHCLIVDDFFGNREDADSPVISEKVFSEFAMLMTRLPDPFIVFVLATRWNPNDLIGRIIDESEKNVDYPFDKKDYICLPGISDQYESGYLFPEKYPPKWYRAQKAALVTEYEFSSVMQQQPIIRGGNLFKIDNIQIIEKKDVPEHVKEVITIDLASTEVSRKSKDPDYTVCLKGGMVYNKGVPSLYITDLLRFRENATRRNKLIKNFILRHGVRVYMEAIAGYKDSYQTMRDTLMGIISVLKMPQLSGDKVVKASPMEPIFESGNVHLVKGLWNQDLISEVGAFSPSMNHKHDDIVDCMAMIYHIFKKKPRVYNTNKIY